MMYNDLLLSRGGGIIPDNIKVGMDNCVVINIGLGGTGVDCLAEVKKEVYSRIFPENPDLAIPEYNHIKFLAIDSYIDRPFGNLSNSDLSYEEFFDISFKGHLGKTLLENPEIIENSPEYREWFRFKEILVPYNTSPYVNRQIGRYLFMRKANDFVSKLSSLIAEAKNGLVNPRVYVNIFTGLGGMTGSGIFLDVCYLIQRTLEFESCITSGYFFLPDVNFSRATDKETRESIQINGYAALQELDYCMNFSENGDKWSQEYSEVGRIETNNPPVDCCYLISGKTFDGSVTTDPYNHAIESVAEYCLSWMVMPKFTYETLIAGMNCHLSMSDRFDGACNRYLTIGISKATIPYKEILTYLTSKTYEAFSKIKENKPVKEDIDEFVMSNGLTFDNLFNMLTAQADMLFPIPDNSYRDAHKNDDLTTKYFADIRARVSNVIKKNYIIMSKDIESYDIAFDATSIITRIFKALYRCIIDPEKGPYFASKLVNGNYGQNLIAVFDGYIRRIECKISQIEWNLEQYQTKREADRDKFFGSRARRSNYNNYLNSTRDLIIQYTTQETYYVAKNFFNNLRRQLIALSNDFLTPYCLTINTLIDTFNYNRRYLENIIDDGSSIEYQISTIEDLKESLDKIINKIDVQREMNDFLKYMLSAEGCKTWMANDENEISKLVSNYFTKVFSEYTDKSMTSYIQDKYRTNNSNELIKVVEDDIMNQLYIMSRPLLWTSSKYNTNNIPTNGIISVPDISSEICEAAQKFSWINNLGVRQTARQDITFTNVYYGVPLYVYQLIDDIEVLSMNDTQYGKHLYEGCEYKDDKGNLVRGRDWHLLPSITPLSKMDDNNSEVLVKYAEKAKEVYDKAELFNLISEVGIGEYVFRTIDDSFIDEIASIAETAKAKDDAVVMFEASEKIKNMKANLTYSRKVYQIKNDARNGDDQLTESEKRRVRIDHFAFAPKLVKIAEIQLGKLSKIDKMIASLESEIADIQTLYDFANALFTGVITINGILITYVNDSFEEVRLSALNMPMGEMRLYQAFVNYKKLDEVTRKKIKLASDKRNTMKEDKDCIIAACTNVKAQLDQKNIAMTLQIAMSKFTPKANEIRKFYMNLNSKFNEYLTTNDLVL